MHIYQLSVLNYRQAEINCLSRKFTICCVKTQQTYCYIISFFLIIYRQKWLAKQIKKY